MTDYVNLMHNGRFVAGPFSENLAFEYLLRVQGQSAEYALTYGGYAWQETDETPAMAVENCLVGSTADGTRVYVDIRLSMQDGTGHKTVTHEAAPESFLRFSASGHTILKGKRNTDNNWDSAGQMLDILKDVTVPARGWTLADVGTLYQVWSAWHLNDMKAACKHMAPDARQRWDNRESVICPDVTGQGYSYGSAWLVAPLPAVVVHRSQQLIRTGLKSLK